MLELALQHSFIVMIICSAVPLAISAASGLLVSIIQAATQIQEPTITYAVKFFAICTVLFFGGGIITDELIRFIQELLNSVSLVGKLR